MNGVEENSVVTELGRVAVLMGGWSGERAISLQSGQAILDALLRNGVNAFGIDVTKETILKNLETENIDRAFIALHGKGGEDGVIQSVLEVLDIPYTGSGVAASALAMDKLRTKQLLSGAGLPTPAFIMMDEKSNCDEIVKSLGLPLIVKPTLEGSSLGMARVESVDELKAAYKNAKEFSGDVLVEQWVTGAEYTVAILGDQALPTIELKTPHAFYDYSAKYQSNDTEYLCPCELSKGDEQAIQVLALSAFKHVGATGWGRVDFMCDEDNNPWVIEINTVPGMTDHSLVPMAAKENGIDFDMLVLTILKQTLSSSNGLSRYDSKGAVNV